LIRFQADADLDHDIVVAVQRREPAADVLEIAARQDRILVTHDRRTMPGHFRDRLDEGESSPGVFIVAQCAPIGPDVEAIVMVWAVSDAAEWRDQVFHLPSLSRHVFAR
jgi:hypothetical protein